MRTVTILRADITGDEVAEVLSAALGPRHHARRLPETSPGDTAAASAADVVIVEVESKPTVRARVHVVRRADRTLITVHPDGRAFARLINGRGIARRVTHVLRQSAELRMGA